MLLHSLCSAAVQAQSSPTPLSQNSRLIASAALLCCAQDAAMAFPGIGMPMSRHGPSKLRMSSSDTPAVSQPGLHLPGVTGLDAFSNPFPGQAADQGPMAASSLHAALQQQHMAGLGLGPGSLPGSQPGSSNGAAAAAALMAGMGGDPSFTGMMHGMIDAAGGMDHPTAGMNQMQTLMYFAHLGMMASLPGTPTAAMSNSPMAAAAAAAGGMNPMMFSMMNPQQLAAFSAAQQQWQGNMAPSTIANIAAAAAVAATAASKPEVRSKCRRRSAQLASINATTLLAWCVCIRFQHKTATHPSLLHHVP